ncbi:hypothetical protein TcWFU_004260 [Taenia crassiceps]|uniref:Uncharacterized protein n=1 Tax=Taenia crassiceps TaxID=6207 RepID=A0ABR4QQC9_9CEST
MHISLIMECIKVCIVFALAAIVLANEYAGYEQYYQAYGTQQMPEHTDVAEPVMEAAAPTAAMQLPAQTGLELETMSKSDMEAATTESSSATSFTAQEISEKTTTKTSAISLHAPFLLLTTLLPSMH